MTNVLFIGDLYRPGQSENILKTSYIFSSFLKELEVTYEVFISKINYKEPCAREIAFWKKSLIGDQFDSDLTKRDLENTVVIGFEISEVDKRYLNQVGIDWISLSIHPLRFMDDLYFSVENSMNLDLSRSTVKKGFIDLSAKVLIQRYNTSLVNIKDNKSLCIIDQCNDDKSIFINNEFKNLKKYEDKIDKIVKNYDKIFYRSHPYNKNDKICNYFITRYDAKILEEPDIYKIFSEKSITSFCGISSSLLYEAESFGLKSIFLDRNPLKFSEPVNYCSLIEDEKFWFKALKLKKNPQLTNFSKAIPKNYLRRIYGKWSYQSEEELFFNEINIYQKSKLDHEVYLINEKFHQSALDFSAKQAESNSLIDSIEGKLVQFDSDTSNLRISLGQFKEGVESALKSNSTTINDSSKISKNALESSVNAQNVSLKAVQASDKALKLSAKSKEESAKAMGISDEALDLSGRAIKETKNANAISTEAFDLSVKAIDESVKSKTLTENIAIDVKNIKKENTYTKKIAKKALDASKDASDRSLESKSMSIEALEMSKRGIEEISKANVIVKQTKILVAEARSIQAEALSKLEVSSSELNRIKTKKLWKIFKVMFYLEDFIEKKITNYNSYKAFRNLRVPWHKHLYRTFAVLYFKSDKKWHTHLYRCTLSMFGSEKYSPIVEKQFTSGNPENTNKLDTQTYTKRNGLKVLQLTNYKIEDYNQGGKIRCFEIRKVLKEDGYDVRTLSFSLGDKDRIENHHIEIDKIKLFEKIKDGTISDWAICDYIKNSDILLDKLCCYTKNFNPDILILEQPFLWPLLKELIQENLVDQRCLIVNSTHNIEHLLKESIYKTVFSDNDAVKYTSFVKELEENLTKSSDLTLCVSKTDCDYFRNLNKSIETYIFPNGSRKFPLGNSKNWKKKFNSTKNNWVFVASWHNPNIDGVRRLIKYGLQDQDASKIKLWIIGGVGQPIREYLDNHSTNDSVVQIVGECTDTQIADIIENSTGIILPIWEGGGSNLKTAQALLAGKYIISTNHAFRGYESFKLGKSIFITDNEVEFLQAMCSVENKDCVGQRDGVEQLEWNNILSSLPNIIKLKYLKKNLVKNIDGTIYLDVTSLHNLKGNYTGITRVISSIIPCLYYIVNNLKYVYYCEKENSFYEYNYLNKSIIRKISIDNSKSIFITPTDSWNYNGYIECLNSMSMSNTRIFVLLYDCIPVYLPHSFGPKFAEKYITWLKNITNNGVEILTISESSKRDYLNFCKSNNLNFRNSVHTIRLGDLFDNFNSDNDLEDFHLDEDFILCVGTVEFRKNHQILLDAYRILSRNDADKLPKLIIVGSQGWMDNHILHQIQFDPILNQKLVWYDDLNDIKLKYLYENCIFTVYPSIYEGWGLPVAESFASGKNCILSELTSLPEICNKVSTYANPYDPYDWAEKIEKLVFDKDYRKKKEEQILLTYPRQNWINTTIDIVSAFSQ